MTWTPPTFVDKEDGGTQHLDSATLNGMVGAISTALSAGSGSGVILPWVTATAYKAGQPVTNGGITYLAVDDHTSGATFAGDLAAHWAVLPLNRLGGPTNPVTDPAAARPTGLTVVWWKTSTIPTNAAVGDVRMVP